jgi:electron-transferring-flavoprotein dehydrogenase
MFNTAILRANLQRGGKSSCRDGSTSLSRVLYNPVQPQFSKELQDNANVAMTSPQKCHYSTYFHHSKSTLLLRRGRAIESKRLNTYLKNNYDEHVPLSISGRNFSSVSEDDDDLLNSERESMPYDVVIVGGGPSGLAAGIRIKQMCKKKNLDLSVCIVEKGNEIGAHILSGNVFDPKAICELFPDMKEPDDWTKELLEAQSSHATPVVKDKFMVLTATSSFTIPDILLPKQLCNEGNYIISLGQLCRWLGAKAEELGVEVYPGFAANEVLYNEDKTAVRGIATRDVGIGKDGKPRSTFERGVELLGRQTIFAEGARGSCSESIISHFDLRKDCSMQTYGLGIKEVWEIPEEQHQPGLVQHTLGYPLQSSPMDKTFGGSFLYHQAPNLVLAGLVIGLDYQNPYINPYQEFQRWKAHPEIRKHFTNGTCISYGARVLNEGGFHSIPKLAFPGGVLIGCSAGFLNAVKIKGSHTAIKSGMLAAESIFHALETNNDGSEIQSVALNGEIDSSEEIKEVHNYEEQLQKSWVYDELHEVRNCHESFARWGVLPGLMFTGIVTNITKGKEPLTLHHNDRDTDKTMEATNFEPIVYPSADGVLTFDLLTSLQRSGTYHEDDQEAHLRIKPEDEHIPLSVSMQVYGAPEQRFCPAGVYEYVKDDDKNSSLVINAQNCVHCKCCSIKTPGEYINWTVPEGGGGPQYQIM